jgi:hypothetical protein
MLVSFVFIFFLKQNYEKIHIKQSTQIFCGAGFYLYRQASRAFGWPNARPGSGTLSFKIPLLMSDLTIGPPLAKIGAHPWPKGPNGLDLYLYRDQP